MRHTMPRSRGHAGGLLITVIGLPLFALSLVFLQRGMPLDAASTPIYSVADLRAALDRQPTAWLGRPLYVRGVAEGCVVGAAGPGSSCLDPGPSLVDQADAGADGAILLGCAPPSWLAAQFGRVPFLGPLVEYLDPPPTIHWGARAVYRVKIIAFPAMPDAPGVEYEALLLPT